MKTLIIALTVLTLGASASAKSSPKTVIARSAQRGYHDRNASYDNPGKSLTADAHTRDDYRALKAKLLPSRVKALKGTAPLRTFFTGFAVVTPADKRDHQAYSLRIGVAGQFDYGTYHAVFNKRTQAVYWLGRAGRY